MSNGLVEVELWANASILLIEAVWGGQKTLQITYLDNYLVTFQFLRFFELPVGYTIDKANIKVSENWNKTNTPIQIFLLWDAGPSEYVYSICIGCG